LTAPLKKEPCLPSSKYLTIINTDKTVFQQAKAAAN
jgi:hypothetical protein